MIRIQPYSTLYDLLPHCLSIKEQHSIDKYMLFECSRLLGQGQLGTVASRKGVREIRHEENDSCHFDSFSLDSQWSRLQLSVLFVMLKYITARSVHWECRRKDAENNIKKKRAMKNHLPSFIQVSPVALVPAARTFPIVGYPGKPNLPSDGTQPGKWTKRVHPSIFYPKKGETESILRTVSEPLRPHP